MAIGSNGEILYLLPDFRNPGDLFATIVLGLLTLLLSIGAILLMFVFGRSTITKMMLPIFLVTIADNICFYIFLFTNADPCMSPISNFCGMLGHIMTIVVDGEIVKIFCIVSTRIKTQHILVAQIFFTITFLITGGSMLATIGFTPDYHPPIVVWINEQVLPIHLGASTLYRMLQLILLMLLTWAHRTTLKKNVNLFQEYRFFMFLFSLDAICSMLTLLFWTLEKLSPVPSSPAYHILLTVTLNSAPLFSGIVLYKVRIIQQAPPPTNGTKYYRLPTLRDPFDAFAILLNMIVFLMLITASCYIAIHLRGTTLSKLILPVYICHMLFEIFHIIHFFTDSPPIFDFLWGFTGLLATTLGVLVDAEIVKIFCVFSKRITVRKMQIVQGCICVLFWIGAAGVIGRLAYLGTLAPDVVENLLRYCTPGYLIILYIYRFIQLILLMQLTWGQHVQTGMLLGRKSERRGYNYNYFWVLFGLDFLLELGYLLIWVHQTTQTEGSSSALVSITDAIGNCLPLVSGLVFFKIREIQKKPISNALTMPHVKYLLSLYQISDILVLLFLLIVFLMHLLCIPIAFRIFGTQSVTRMMVPVFLLHAIALIVSWIHLYFDSPPVFATLCAISVVLAGATTMLVDAEILKNFCIMSTFLTPKMVTKLQIGLCGLTFCAIVGHLGQLFYLGVPPPAFIDGLNVFVTPGVVIITNLLHFLQLLYILKLTYVQMIESKNALDAAYGRKTSDGFRVFWIIFCAEFGVLILELAIFVVETMEKTPCYPNIITLRIVVGTLYPIFSLAALWQIRRTKEKQLSSQGITHQVQSSAISADG
ncbi:hypothetical protein EDD86DRAFT_259221 [Gorgonomyces haynaldii]|nr:hypothetical protein EDD86DRAFT_259221 [Gorgonomyces haynaldii]